MDITYIGWLYDLEEILHPNKFGPNKFNEEYPKNFSSKLSKEVKAFRPYFTSLLSQSKQHAGTVAMQIIDTSDTIYSYFLNLARFQKANPLYEQVFQTYKQTLILLESLLEACGRLDQELITTLPMTAFSTTNKRINLKMKLDRLIKRITNSNIDDGLGKLLISDLRLLISRQRMSRADAEYTSLILDQLEKLDPFSTFEVENILYQYDFNTIAFFNYFAKCCNKMIDETPSLHYQLEILIKIEDRINSLPFVGTSRWMLSDDSIHDQIKRFIKEKKLSVHQRMELKRDEIKDNQLIDGTDRMQVNLPVAQLGLFIRMFMEKNLLPKEDIGKTFAYYARHFCTPKTPFISAESLQKKSTNVEFATAKKIKGHLIGMINWLNDNYNTSNHKES